MPFAKNFFDVGLFTNQADAVRAFYSRSGLTLDHTLKLGGGVLQHRYQAGEAVLKINDARETLAPRPADNPLMELIIAAGGCVAPATQTDPDGTRVTWVPQGHEGIEGLAVRLGVSDLKSSSAFYTQALGLAEEAPGLLRCGRALLMLQETERTHTTESPLAAVGLRYLTLQVQDCDAAYARALQAGATSGRAPVTLGNTARIAFVHDPDGTWIEISERASVTGRAV